MKPRIGDRVKHINHPQFGVGEVVNLGIDGAEVKWGIDRVMYHQYKHLNHYFDTAVEALESMKRNTLYVGAKVRHIHRPELGIGEVTNEGKAGVWVYWGGGHHILHQRNDLNSNVVDVGLPNEPETRRIETFWIVWSPSSGGNPQAKHPYEDKARHEAERLSKKQPDRVFHVLKCIGTVKTTNNPTTEWY